MEGITALFSYGTLQNEELQKILFGRTFKMAQAILENWGRYENEDGYYYICKEDNNRVDGMVIYFDSMDELWLADQWEEIPRYTRIKVDVRLNDQTLVEAWAYVQLKGPGKAAIRAFSSHPLDVDLKAATDFKIQICRNSV